MKFGKIKFPHKILKRNKRSLGQSLDADAIIDAMEVIAPEDFYRRSHQIIFQAMIQLNDRSESIDLITLKAEIEKATVLKMLAA